MLIRCLNCGDYFLHVPRGRPPINSLMCYSTLVYERVPVFDSCKDKAGLSHDYL